MLAAADAHLLDCFRQGALYRLVLVINFIAARLVQYALCELLYRANFLQLIGGEPPVISIALSNFGRQVVELVGVFDGFAVFAVGPLNIHPDSHFFREIDVLV